MLNTRTDIVCAFKMQYAEFRGGNHGLVSFRRPACKTQIIKLPCVIFCPVRVRNITVYEDNRVGIQSIRLVINIQNSTAFGGYMVKKMIEQQERQMAGK